MVAHITWYTKTYQKGTTCQKKDVLILESSNRQSELIIIRSENVVGQPLPVGTSRSSIKLTVVYLYAGRLLEANYDMLSGQLQKLFELTAFKTEIYTF